MALVKTKAHPRRKNPRKGHRDSSKLWTLQGGRWKGWGFCCCCNEAAEGGGDFCSGYCSSIHSDMISIPLREAGETQSRFTHNCSLCHFLGTYYGPSQDEQRRMYYDLYVCGSRGLNAPSLIARYGNEPHEYLSSPLPERFSGDPNDAFMDAEEWYRVCLCRAQEARILQENHHA